MALPLVEPHQPQHVFDRIGGVAGRNDVVARLLLIDVATQDPVEHVVRRQRILVGLVVAQLGRRRARNHCRRNHRRTAHGIAPFGQAEHLGLVQVLERGIAAAHVAVDGGVTHRVLALVAGGQQQPAELVGQRHQDHPAAARLQVFFGHIRLGAFEHRAECGEQAFERRLDRNGFQLDAQRAALLLGQIVGEIGGVARRQPHRSDVVAAQRIDRHRQHQRRIDATGQSQPHLAEAVLAAIVLQPAHHCAPGQRVHALVAIVHPHHRGEAALAGGVVHHQPLIDERGSGRMHGAVGIGHHRCAVEHQRVLPADHVEIGNRRPALAGALGQQGIALRVLAALVRRGIGHQHQLGAGLHGLCERLGKPQVLADHHAHLHALDRDHAVVAIRIHVEIAALVEHRVVGQLALAIGRRDASVAQHAGCVVDHAAGTLRPADHHHDPTRAGGDACQRFFAMRQKTGPQQQIFRWVAADRQLGKQHDVCPELVARCRDELDDAIGIARHGADREVELRHGDAKGLRHGKAYADATGEAWLCRIPQETEMQIGVAAKPALFQKRANLPRSAAAPVRLSKPHPNSDALRRPERPGDRRAGNDPGRIPCVCA
ncbi:hypothetical protein XHC_3373 [Xanthomonas hortorum pv. carotae str. M081]|nr:hypothetical protein XHC_3373 [Xanthomonas hortorum pv. carotae str. M081]